MDRSDYTPFYVTYFVAFSHSERRKCCWIR